MLEKPAPDGPSPEGPVDHFEPASSTGPESSTGPRRILIALYAVFAVAATARATVQLFTKFDEAPLAYGLSMLSGIIYIAATVGLISRRGFARPLALTACSVELLGVLIVGTLSVLDSQAFPDDTVWSRFGSGYGYVPLILPILGLWFLSKQRRLPPRAR